MKDDSKYYLVRKKAVPEVLLKVMEAKRLLDSSKVMTIQEAAEAVGISRSSFYKYKDDILPFNDKSRGKNITLMLQVDDIPGLLSAILNIAAENGANILTIHQTIPVNGIASITLSMEILGNTDLIEEMLEKMEAQNGVQYVKILARE